MSDAVAAPVTLPESLSSRARRRKALGPVVVGALGGLLAGGYGLVGVGTLPENMACTYDKFPSLARPWMAHHVGVPTPLLIVLAAVGLAAPAAMGLATVLVARPRDVWEDLSAGITAGLTATLTGLLTGLGSASVVALVVVPSIADLTLLGTAAGAPAGAVLEERYPDLLTAPARERGGLMMAKITADQVNGCVTGSWAAVAAALASCGVLGLCGTLAAGPLTRRGDRLRTLLVPYLELSLSNAVLAGLVVRLWEPGVLGIDGPGPGPLVLLAAVNLGVFFAVRRRLGWLTHLALALAWGVTLIQAQGVPVPLILGVSAYAGALYLVLRSLRPAPTLC